MHKVNNIIFNLLVSKLKLEMHPQSRVDCRQVTESIFFPGTIMKVKIAWYKYPLKWLGFNVTAKKAFIKLKH